MRTAMTLTIRRLLFALFLLVFAPSMRAQTNASISVGGGTLTYQYTTSGNIACGISPNYYVDYYFYNFSFNKSGGLTGSYSADYYQWDGNCDSGVQEGAVPSSLQLQGNTFYITFTPGAYGSGSATYTALTVPTLSVSSSANPSTYGGAVAFTATISSGPTGTIYFYDGSTQIGSGTISGTTATFTTSSLKGGTHSITAYYPGNGTKYTAVTSSALTETVNKATPTLSWSTPSPINYGTALSGTQLDATASVGGTFAYSPASGTVLTAAQHTLSVTFTPTDSTDYATVSGSVSLTVNKATPSISWPSPYPIVYGTPLSSTQLDATTSVAGIFSYNPPPGTVLYSGTYTLTTSFTPTDTNDYNSANASVSLVVQSSPTEPVITGMSPTQGDVGNMVTITGENLGTSGGVTFNGVAATTWSWTTGQITVPVPKGATSGNVVVTIGSTAIPGTGSFTVLSSAISTATEFSYDPMGRVSQRTICTPMNCGNGQGLVMNYGYDGIGDITSLTFNSVTLSYTYDAAVHVTQVTSSWSDAQHPGTIATFDNSIGYYPDGSVRKLTLGNGLTETYAMNDRMQPCRMNVNTSATALATCTDAIPSGNVQDLTYGFNAGVADNGTLQGLTGVGAQGFNRSYGYDNLNRLQSMTAPGDSCSGLSWTYDPWGNRLAQTATGGTCPQPSIAVNANNQLAAPFTYDASGDLTYDTNHNYTYDAENRVVQVDGGSTATYVYDAFGQRVEKTSGGSDEQYVYMGGEINTIFTNGAMERTYLYVAGERVAEYVQGTTKFIHTDNLGSTRLLTAMSGAVSESDDYLPFGETSAAGDRLKFDGKEYDAESNLDNFGARYYGSQFGRFITPDWAERPTAVPYALYGDPQSLNLYTLVRNDPVSRADADGHSSNPYWGPGGGIDLFSTFVNAGAAEAQADDALLARAQQTQNQLSAAAVTKIIQQALASGADAATLGIQLFNGLGNNVSVTGDALRQGIKDSNVKLDDTTNALVANISSVTKTGDQVTIKNSTQSSTNISGYTLSVDKTVSFRVGVSTETNLPGLYNVKGISGGQGALTGSLSKAQVILEGGHKYLQLDVRKGFIPIPLHPKIPLD
jgi:RHS repeat-associated protein